MQITSKNNEQELLQRISRYENASYELFLRLQKQKEKPSQSGSSTISPTQHQRTVSLEQIEEVVMREEVDYEAFEKIVAQIQPLTIQNQVVKMIKVLNKQMENMYGKLTKFKQQLQAAQAKERIIREKYGTVL